ncbi:MAG TPA: LegC family aminotransferase [Candidatus Melainabacteria bacterium]|mgnify:CR=1 FL=1|nr:LegC family aminotransferase [Candidatus Melainabacteria bacterium]
MTESKTRAETTFVDKLLSALADCLPEERPIPLHAPIFEGNEWHYVKDCLDTGWVSSVGAYVNRFETELSRYTGAKNAIATVNGTCALMVSLRALGVEPDDEVLVPDLTFVATANAVSHLGAVPHFVDCSLETLGVDPEKLKSWLEKVGEKRKNGLFNRETGRRVKALIAMHTFGHPCRIDDIKEVCESYNVILVEDAAESIGSFYKGKHTGLWGKASTLSFNGNKTITTGGGGAVITDDDELASKIRHLTTTAKEPHIWRFFHDQVGYNFRMPNLNAALGCAQLERLDQFIASKRALLNTYKKAMQSIEGATIFEEPPECNSNYWLHVLILDKSHAPMLTEILDKANHQGFQVRPAWELMHTLPMYCRNPKMPTRTAEQLRNSVLCLPSSANL